MASQQIKDFAEKHGFSASSYLHDDVFYCPRDRFEVGEVSPGVYFYGPVCGTRHFRKEVEGLEKLVSHLFWDCGVELPGLTFDNPPPIP